MRVDGRIVWCFVSDYCKIETNMNSMVYARLLRDMLSQIYEPGQVFVQDNSRVHTARLIRDLLMDLGVWWLPHPARSPDLNAIEHFWFKFKETVHRLHSELIDMQKGREKLIEAMKGAVRDAFAELEAIELWDFPAKLIESMPRRFSALRLARGAQTKY